MKRTTSAMPESMIDLIWILLFFFLLISTVKKDEDILIEAVGHVGKSPLDPQLELSRAVVEITAEGELVLDGRPIPRDSLSPSLRQLQSGESPPKRLIIRVDRGASVERLFAVEDAGRSLGLECLIERRQKPPLHANLRNPQESAE